MKRFLHLLVFTGLIFTGVYAQNPDTTSSAIITKIDSTPVSDFVKTSLASVKQGISNVSGHFSPASVGHFEHFDDFGFALSDGIIISTGLVEAALHPNDTQGAGIQLSNQEIHDNTLNQVTIGKLFDVSFIEFDFIPSTNMIDFNYIFASEEYPEYVNSMFNDIFGFFISGPGIVGEQNIALIPQSSYAVSINTVNHLTSPEYYVSNLLYDTMPHPFFNFLQYDGMTVPLTAEARVTPFETYHIKLIIADLSDGLWDSAVFIKGNSFESKPLVFDFNFTEDNYEKVIYEDSTLLKISATLPAPAQADITYHFSYAGEAQLGVDYIAPESFTFFAGDTTASFKIKALGDQITEGDESFMLIIDETQDTLNITIKESSIVLGNHHAPITEMVQLTPNPANDVFAIPNDLKAKSVTIYSLAGKQIKQFNDNFNTMDISDLPKGLYSIRIQTLSNTLVSKLKVD